MTTTKVVRQFARKGKIFTAVGIIAVLAMAICGRAWADQQSVQGGTALPVLIQMGDTTLKVPSNYLFGSISHEGRDSTGIAFDFRVLLPDMEPRTAENTNDFEVRGWGRKILIAVFYNGPSATGKNLFNIMMRDQMHGITKSGTFSVTTQRTPPNR